MKRIITAFLAALMAFAVLGCASSSNINFNPGTYQGSAPGFNGDVTMEVTVDAGRILGVRVVSQNDTPEISGLAYERIPAAIVAGQTLAVDIVSGATYSSQGIINAVSAALEKSGVNIAALKKRGPAAAAAPRSSKKETYDVVVVGAGGAGLAAAIAAQQAGARVVVLEKMPRAGGNTIISGAAYNAADPARQASVPMNAANRAAIQQLVGKTPHDAFEAELQQTVGKQFAEFTAANKSGLFDSP